MRRDAFADVTAILHPLPDPPELGDVDLLEGYDAVRDEVEREREHTVTQLRLSWEEGDLDPVLSALESARRAKEHAETQIRHLLAYGREFVQPRPYTLGDLAEATGMSISGVRTGYDHHDVDAVAETTGAKPRDWRAPEASDADHDALSELIADLERRTSEPFRERVLQVFHTLQHRDWTPHTPSVRTPGTKAAKRYIRWVRTWPAGTTVTLYQEAGYLAASGKIAESDPRRFSVDYTEHDPNQVAEQLDAFARRIDTVDQARTAAHAS